MLRLGEACGEEEGLRFTGAVGGGPRIRGDGRELEAEDMGEGDLGFRRGIPLCWAC